MPQFPNDPTSSPYEASPVSDMGQGLVIPSLKGFAGELGFDDVAALNLSRIEGAEELDMPLIGHLQDEEEEGPFLQPSSPMAAYAAASSRFPSRASAYAEAMRARNEPTYRFGMKQRRIRYDQSFFI